MIAMVGELERIKINYIQSRIYVISIKFCQNIKGAISYHSKY